jgi:hypothetical protein
MKNGTLFHYYTYTFSLLPPCDNLNYSKEARSYKYHKFITR